MAIAYKRDLSLNDKLLIGFVRAGEFSKRLLNTVLRNYGLTFPQYNVLRVLDASVKGHNTSSNVCKIMIVSGANITGIAKRLEKNGFLIRKGDPKDGRITLLAITPKGGKTLIISQMIVRLNPSFCADRNFRYVKKMLPEKKSNRYFFVNKAAFDYGLQSFILSDIIFFNVNQLLNF